MVSRQRFGKQ